MTFHLHSSLFCVNESKSKIPENTTLLLQLRSYRNRFENDGLHKCCVCSLKRKNSRYSHCTLLIVDVADNVSVCHPIYRITSLFFAIAIISHFNCYEYIGTGNWCSVSNQQLECGHSKIKSIPHGMSWFVHCQCSAIVVACFPRDEVKLTSKWVNYRTIKKVHLVRLASVSNSIRVHLLALAVISISPRSSFFRSERPITSQWRNFFGESSIIILGLYSECLWIRAVLSLWIISQIMELVSDLCGFGNFKFEAIQYPIHAIWTSSNIIFFFSLTTFNLRFTDKKCEVIIWSATHLNAIYVKW